jgi:hypothetical protein
MFSRGEVAHGKRRTHGVPLYPAIPSTDGSRSSVETCPRPRLYKIGAGRPGETVNSARSERLDPALVLGRIKQKEDINAKIQKETSNY